MSEDPDSRRPAQWLGTAAVDAARVGPFELRSVGAERFDLYLESFAEPLARGVSALEADTEARRLILRIAECDARLRPVPVSSFPPARSSRSPRSSSQRASSKRSSRRAPRRVTRTTTVIGVVCGLALMSVLAYYVGTTQIPGMDPEVIVH
jgi:hypothetical protein